MFKILCWYAAMPDLINDTLVWEYERLDHFQVEAVVALVDLFCAQATVANFVNNYIPLLWYFPVFDELENH